MSRKSINEARALFHSKAFGILSTLSQKLDGYPFGSVVPYCLDGEGMSVMLLSHLAEHTKNIKQDDRCSITIVSDKDNIQSNARLCMVGHMERLSDEETVVMERYFRHFPSSRRYIELNFFFYRLRPIAIRFIEGFGKVDWLEPARFLVQNPFQGKGEERIIDHMNKDHQKDLIRYCEYYKSLDVSPEDNVRMVGIDRLGFDVFVNDNKVRFNFEQPINNAVEARTALVKLSKDAK